MNYDESIQLVIDFIEDNLCYELDLKTLANIAGYSQHHFIRIFTESVHLTPGDYIRKRRLSEIVHELEGTRCSICEIAFKYGFNSKENFTRAFKSEHHILPSEYKKKQNSLKLHNKIELHPLPLKLEAAMIQLDGFHLTVYDSDEDYAPHFWNKYNCNQLSKKLSGGKNVTDYGVSHWNCHSQKLDYCIGIPTRQVDNVPSDTRTIYIPSGTYAVFSTPKATHFDFVHTIHNTWNFINQIWLPNNDYIRIHGYEFETYIEDSHIYSEKIYIPIQKK